MVNKRFLREFFGIPRKYKLEWAVIVEKNKDGSKSCRLGLLLDGNPKAVDVMKRRFIQNELLLPVVRKTYPADGSAASVHQLWRNELVDDSRVYWCFAEYFSTDKRQEHSRTLYEQPDDIWNGSVYEF